MSVNAQISYQSCFRLKIYVVIHQEYYTCDYTLEGDDEEEIFILSLKMLN